MANQKNDYRGIPTPMCPKCGSNWFKMAVMFDEISYLPAVYGLDDAECWKCGSLVTPATPLDRAPYPPCKICGEEEGLIDGYCWDCDPLDEDFYGN